VSYPRNVPPQARRQRSKPEQLRSQTSGYCTADCDRPAFSKGLCVAHLKRQQRGIPLDVKPVGEVLSPEEQVYKAGTDLLECSSEDDDLWRYRRKQFLKAATRWVKAMGWRPPSNASRRVRNA
jgi:hypothetical protein